MSTSVLSDILGVRIDAGYSVLRVKVHQENILTIFISMVLLYATSFSKPLWS